MCPIWSNVLCIVLSRQVHGDPFYNLLRCLFLKRASANSMYKSTTTLSDVYHLALPPATKLLVGAEFLNRPVSWACSLRPSPPAFPKLDGNELALVDMEDLRRLDPRGRLERVISNLRVAGVSGVVVLGEVPEVAVSAAVESGIALFELPPSVSLIHGQVARPGRLRVRA